MKKLFTIVLVALSAVSFAQGIVKNGAIYKQHPYITAIVQLNALFPKGDTLGMARYYTDSAKFVDAVDPSKPSNLTQAKANWHAIFEGWEQLTVKQIGFPDGLEYLTEPFTVQSWWEVSAVNKKTKKKATFEEVIFDTFNKDGKISMELSYYDTGALIAAMK